MVSGRSIEGCEMERDGGSLRCDRVKGVGSTKWSEGTKVRRWSKVKR